MAIYSRFTHLKWWFSIVMLVYQMVITTSTAWNQLLLLGRSAMIRSPWIPRLLPRGMSGWAHSSWNRWPAVEVFHLTFSAFAYFIIFWHGEMHVAEIQPDIPVAMRIDAHRCANIYIYMCITNVYTMYIYMYAYTRTQIAVSNPDFQIKS